MQGVGGVLTLLRSFLTLHVQGNSRRDVWFRANAIHRLLHLAMTAVAAFHGIGSRRQKFVVQKRQRLLQVGREQLLQCLADLLEATNATSEPREFVQRGFGTAATVEEAIDLIHDVSKCSQFRPPAGDALERSLLSPSQLVPDE